MGIFHCAQLVRAPSPDDERCDLASVQRSREARKQSRLKALELERGEEGLPSGKLPGLCPGDEGMSGVVHAGEGVGEEVTYITSQSVFYVVEDS